MKFNQLKHAKSFIESGLKIGVIKSEEVALVLECEIYTNCFNPDSQDPRHACGWSESGIAGRLMQRISNEHEYQTATLANVNALLDVAKDRIESATLLFEKVIERKDMLLAEKEIEINKLKSRLTKGDMLDEQIQTKGTV